MENKKWPQDKDQIMCGCKIFFFFFFPKKFIYFLFHWIFVALHSLSLVVTSGGFFLLQCMSFSLQWLVLLQSTGFNSCGLQAQYLWLRDSRVQAKELWYTGLAAPGMKDLPRPGMEPRFPALAGGFPSTASPEKSLLFIFKIPERFNVVL